VLARIWVVWDVTLRHWVIGSNILKDHIAIIFKGNGYVKILPLIMLQDEGITIHWTAKKHLPRDTASLSRTLQSLALYGFKIMFTLTSHFLYKFSGCPAITIPIKLSEQGLPLSLQLMAQNYREGVLLAVAKWIENVVDFPCLKLET